MTSSQLAASSPAMVEYEVAAESIHELMKTVLAGEELYTQPWLLCDDAGVSLARSAPRRCKETNGPIRRGLLEI